MLEGATYQSWIEPCTWLCDCGPVGLLGAVEGLSYLAIVAGLVIAGFTVKDFGSIPEAVPTEGGRCS